MITTCAHRGTSVVRRGVPGAVPVLALLAILATVRAPGAAAQVGPELVTTSHRITLGGNGLAYTARAGRLPIRHNDTEKALGDVFFTWYAVEPGPGAPARPLTFLWNGGPGANSVLLHLHGVGPKRVRPGVDGGARRRARELGDPAGDPPRRGRAVT